MSLPSQVANRSPFVEIIIVILMGSNYLSLPPTHTQQNSDLTGCDLQYANLRGSNLAGAVLEDITAPLHMSQTVNVTTVHANLSDGGVIVNPAAVLAGAPSNPPQAQGQVLVNSAQ